MAEIPKKLHFIWMGKDLPRKYLRNIAFWAARNPDYEINIWTNQEMRIVRAMTMHDDMPSFTHRLRLFKELVLPRAFEAIIIREMNGPFNNYAAASDVLRLAILFVEGGIYLDTDVVSTEGTRLGRLRSSHGFLVGSGAANHSTPQNAVMASAPLGLIVFNILLMISRYYRTGFMNPDDAWQAKRVPARADDAMAPRRMLTIAMSGPSVVEEFLQSKGFIGRTRRTIAAGLRFPMHCLTIPCDKNWLGIGKYRSAEW